MKCSRVSMPARQGIYQLRYCPGLVICFHDDSYFDWGEMESPCNLDFLLQWWLRILNIFSFWLTICNSSFENSLFLLSMCLEIHPLCVLKYGIFGRNFHGCWVEFVFCSGCMQVVASVGVSVKSLWSTVALNSEVPLLIHHLDRLSFDERWNYVEINMRLYYLVVLVLWNWVYQSMSEYVCFKLFQILIGCSLNQYNKTFISPEYFIRYSKLHLFAFEFHLFGLVFSLLLP